MTEYVCVSDSGIPKCYPKPKRYSKKLTSKQIAASIRRQKKAEKMAACYRAKANRSFVSTFVAALPAFSCAVPDDVLCSKVPQEPAFFTAKEKPGKGEIELEWTNPNDSDLAGVIIRYSTDGTYPKTPKEGEGGIDIEFTGAKQGQKYSYIHKGLAGYKTYCYSIFAYDHYGNCTMNFSKPVHASAGNSCGDAKKITIDGSKWLEARDIDSLDAGSVPGTIRLGKGTYKADANTVGLWHLDKDTLAVDFSSYKNHGAYYGTTVVPGVSGWARKFKGTSDYLEIPYSSSLDLTTQFTVEMWINPDPFRTRIQGLVGRCCVCCWPTRSWDIILASNGKIEFPCSSSTDGQTQLLVSSKSATQADKWQHLAIVFDKGKVSFYLDGKLDNLGTVSATQLYAHTKNLRIGASHCDLKVFTGIQHYTGIMDNVRISNIARTSFNVDYNSDGTYESQAIGLSSYISFPHNVGKGATISWVADTPVKTSICFQTRTATASTGLSSAKWGANENGSFKENACYQDGAEIAVEAADPQYIQTQIILKTDDVKTTPVVTSWEIGNLRTCK